MTLPRTARNLQSLCAERTMAIRRPNRPTPQRRYEDARRRVAEQLRAGRLDDEEARWELLRQRVRVGHAYQEWIARGAPKRRRTDRGD